MERLKVSEGIDLTDEIAPLLSLCAGLRTYVEQIDAKLLVWLKSEPVCRRFMEIPGVGPICAASFYTAIEDPERFARPSDVAAYLGLAPRILQSGRSMRHAGISKMGNQLTRSHLVLAAGATLRLAAPDGALKIWGQNLSERIGRGKAKVAVARKLAVLMIALWKNGTDYEVGRGQPTVAASA